MYEIFAEYIYKQNFGVLNLSLGDLDRTCSKFDNKLVSVAFNYCKYCKYSLIENIQEFNYSNVQLLQLLLFTGLSI